MAGRHRHYDKNIMDFLFGILICIMNTKPMYQYMAELLDFAEEISARIHQDEFENESYFMTLIYIEDILDKYGRGLASRSARDRGLTKEQILTVRIDLNTRLEALRAKIRNLSQAYDFDQAMTERAQSIIRDWQKRG